MDHKLSQKQVTRIKDSKYTLPCMLHRVETNFQLAKQDHLSQFLKEVPSKKYIYKIKDKQKRYGTFFAPFSVREACIVQDKQILKFSFMDDIIKKQVQMNVLLQCKGVLGLGGGEEFGPQGMNKTRKHTR